MTVLKTTCQICGRAHKSKNGVIAHHGYKRPHQQGWQTASCYGARHLPYEVSCDIIPLAITSCQAHIDCVTEALASWIANPPATIDRVRKDAWGTTQKTETFTRPEGFSETKRYYGMNDSNYEMWFKNRKYNLQNDINASTETIKYLQNRLANWKAPEVEA